MTQLTVRKPDFSFASDIPLIPDLEDINYSSLSFATSIIAPHIERYIIRSMRKALQAIDNPSLREDIKAFASQEASHLHQHDKMNKTLRQKLSPEAQKNLAQAEDDLSSDYNRFSKSKSLKFNLAYAEGFESATCALSLWAFEHQTFKTLESRWQSLLEWHLAEEIEHRTVAFDAFHALGGQYSYRLLWGSYAQLHLVRYLLRFAQCYKQTITPPIGNKNILKQHRWSLIRKIAKTVLPGYSPHNLEIDKRINDTLAKYSQLQKT
ncbi:hypothetical protein R50073_25540 [Maricurvus nonylphenolicus]|uniref:metal-dependent hydrolase n=1 Tax=Maricurvus nonylphenolicus TaxID=1008307 RepID=UPI0036F283F3